MCDRLITLDGTELQTVGDLVREGLLPETRLDVEPRYPGYDPARECLCGEWLDGVIEASDRMWVEGGGLYEWQETDVEGGLDADPVRWSFTIQRTSWWCSVCEVVDAVPAAEPRPVCGEHGPMELFTGDPTRAPAPNWPWYRS